MGSAAVGLHSESMAQEGRALGRVAFLTNFIPPYRKPVLVEFGRHCRELKVFVSTAMEANRAWAVDWGGLDVQVQKTFTFAQSWRHPKVGGERVFVHLPLDTYSELARFQPDVIVSVEMGLRTALAAAYRAGHRNTRLLAWADYAESTEQGRGKARAVVRGLLKSGVDGFIVNGASGARYLNSLGVASERLFRVPYATDVARFAETDRVPGDRRLVYVGQLIERKGLVPFIESLGRWAAQHAGERIRFELAGDGPLRNELAAIAVPENLRVELLGNLAYERLREVYAEASFFVLPAFADTWGLVVNEAMASGLPVLGSLGAQAVEELVVEGQTGWVFRPESEGSRYSAIERAMACDGDRMAEMGERARRTALKLTPKYTAGLLAQACTAVRSSA